MKICLRFPGAIRPKALAAAESEYAKRLARMGVEISEYRPEKVSGEIDRLRRAEAERLLKELRPEDWVVACDERGTPVSTRAFAELLRGARGGIGRAAGRRRLIFVVGGALGLDESVRERADELWALSSLVMAGGVARIVLLEGLYRAMTIVAGHPYHNE